MKVVIDISKEQLESIKNGMRFRDDVEYIMGQIENGTPLPKNHGRLKDVDAFIEKVQEDRHKASYMKSWTANDVIEALDGDYAPTIIEADKEE